MSDVTIAEFVLVLTGSIVAVVVLSVLVVLVTEFTIARRRERMMDDAYRRPRTIPPQ